MNLTMHAPKLLARFDAASPLTKCGLVALLYAGAGLGAFALAWLQRAAVDWAYPNQDNGMADFGALLLFVVVFGVAAAMPTGLILYAARRSRLFWSLSTALLLIIAVASLVAISTVLIGRPALAGWPSVLAWEPLSVPAFFLSPGPALTALLAALIAPKPFRSWLFLAFALELACVAGGIGHWFVPLWLP